MQSTEINRVPHSNILPYEGCVHYFGQILTETEADTYFEKLLQSIAWQHDQAIIFGKKLTTKRKVAWYGDQAFEYTYSNIHKYALPWTAELRILKALVEAETGETFNACLLNLYHSGEEGMAWHSDGEKDLKKMAQLHHSVLVLYVNLHLNISKAKKKSTLFCKMAVYC